MCARGRDAQRKYEHGSNDRAAASQRDRTAKCDATDDRASIRDADIPAHGRGDRRGEWWRRLDVREL